jgi:hypothetical protein
MCACALLKKDLEKATDQLAECEERFAILIVRLSLLEGASPEGESVPCLSRECPACSEIRN